MIDPRTIWTAGTAPRAKLADPAVEAGVEADLVRGHDGLMHAAPFSPALGHVFVCVNRRPSTDPLGAGCGERGDEVYAATKRAVNGAGKGTTLWVTRTLCLGVCPKNGASVAVYPNGGLHSDVAVEDVPRLLTLATAPRK